MSYNNSVNASSSTQANQNTRTAAEKDASIRAMFAMLGYPYKVFCKDFQDMVEMKGQDIYAHGLGSSYAGFRACSKTSNVRLPNQDDIDAHGEESAAWVNEVNQFREVFRQIALDHYRQSSHYKQVFWRAANL